MERGEGGSSDVRWKTVLQMSSCNRKRFNALSQSTSVVDVTTLQLQHSWVQKTATSIELSGMTKQESCLEAD